MNPFKALTQIAYLSHEISLMINGRWWRLPGCVFGESFGIIFSYRLDRCLFFAFGPAWQIARIFLSPVALLLRPWTGSSEIHYKAAIGKGFQILHPCLGVVISAYADIGDNFILTGGNCIGRRRGGPATGAIRIGHRVILGANATVLGPIDIGNDVIIAAGSVATQNIPDGAVAGGVPAKVLAIRPDSSVSSMPGHLAANAGS